MEKGWDYWVAMALTLLTIFCTALYYFDMRPPRAWHAMRRSRRGGTLFYWIHFLLQLSLLAMGVGLKFCFRALLGEAAAEGEAGCRCSPEPSLMILEARNASTRATKRSLPRASSRGASVQRSSAQWRRCCSAAPRCE